jgi:hypothetical protein
MAGPAASLELTATEAQQLTSWVRAGTTPQRLVRRARVILGSARGLGSRALARQEQLSRTTVRRWLARFATWSASTDSDLSPESSESGAGLSS